MADEEFGGDDRAGRKTRRKSAPRRADQRDFALEKKAMQREAQAREAAATTAAAEQQRKEVEAEGAKYLKPAQRRKHLREAE